MVVNLDLKSKPGDSMNRIESKKLLNKFTNRPETTVPGGNYQSANIIENETNMVQSKGLLQRCEASDTNNLQCNLTS
jgi:hypothetical protein